MHRPVFGSMAWAGLCVLLALPAWFTPWIPIDAPQAWPPAIAPWVLHPSAGWHQTISSWWATAWLHGSPEHLARNLAGVALVGAMGWMTQLKWHSTIAWLMAWPMTHIGMLLQPQLTSYIGLSGVLHAGAAIVALHQIQEIGQVGSRWLGWTLLIGLGVKIVMENPWKHVLILSSASAIKVAPWAHFSGVMAGLVCGVLVHLLTKDPIHSFRRH